MRLVCSVKYDMMCVVVKFCVKCFDRKAAVIFYVKYFICAAAISGLCPEWLEDGLQFVFGPVLS